MTRSTIKFFATPRVDGVDERVLGELVGIKVVAISSVIGSSMRVSSISKKDRHRSFTADEVKNIQSYYNVVDIKALIAECESKERKKATRWLKELAESVNCLLVCTSVAKNFT